MNESATKGNFLTKYTSHIFMCPYSEFSFRRACWKKSQTGRTKLHLQCARPDGTVGQKDGAADDIYSFLLPSPDNDSFTEKRREEWWEKEKCEEAAGCDVWPWALLLRYFPDGLRLASSRVISVHATFRKWFRDGRHAGNRNRCPNFPRSLEQQRWRKEDGWGQWWSSWKTNLPLTWTYLVQWCGLM